MNELTIVTADNGFIVKQCKKRGFIANTWVFETSTALGEFIADLGYEIEQDRKSSQEES